MRRVPFRPIHVWRAAARPGSAQPSASHFLNSPPGKARPGPAHAILEFGGPARPGQPEQGKPLFLPKISLGLTGLLSHCIVTHEMHRKALSIDALRLFPMRFRIRALDWYSSIPKKNGLPYVLILIVRMCKIRPGKNRFEDPMAQVVRFRPKVRRPGP